jgi:hypothetical protein
VVQALIDLRYCGSGLSSLGTTPSWARDKEVVGAGGTFSVIRARKEGTTSRAVPAPSEKPRGPEEQALRKTCPFMLTLFTLHELRGEIMRLKSLYNHPHCRPFYCWRDHHCRRCRRAFCASGSGSPRVSRRHHDPVADRHHRRSCECCCRKCRDQPDHRAALLLSCDEVTGYIYTVRMQPVLFPAG